MNPLIKPKSTGPTNRPARPASEKSAESYLIYSRKSTDEADSQKNSIEYQRRENTRYAENHGLSLASVSLDGFCANGVISERHSGFKESHDLSFSKDGLVQYRIDRPKFQQMVQLLNIGNFKGVICLCWDRMSRNRGDDTVIRKLMHKGVDVRFVYASYDKSSAGELHMDIDGMFAQHHSRVTSEKVILSTRMNRQKGICTYRAPIGYLNPGSMDHKPKDPERAPIIEEMFKRYATGNWSLSDLARFANRQGMTTVPMRRRRTRTEMLAENQLVLPKVSRLLTENHISRILSNPFYLGRILGDEGEYIDSISHEPLVSAAIFKQVQQVLKRKTVSAHYTEKADLPLRGLVRCASCRRVYTPYAKKGHIYYGARCLKGCDNRLRSCAFHQLQGIVKSLLQNLQFTPSQLAELEARIETDKSILEGKRRRAYATIDRQTARLRDDLAYLQANRLTLLKANAYTPDAMAAEEASLIAAIDSDGGKDAISAEEYEQAIREVFSVSELLNSVVSGFEMADDGKKSQIAKMVFSELTLSQDTLDYKVQSDFKYFLNRNSAMCDPIGWISELANDRGRHKD